MEKKLIKNTQRVNPGIIGEFSWIDWRIPLETFQDIHFRISILGYPFKDIHFRISINRVETRGFPNKKEATRFRFHVKILLQHKFFLSSVHKLKVQSLLVSKFDLCFYTGLKQTTAYVNIVDSVCFVARCWGMFTKTRESRVGMERIRFSLT
jgi:hypothetical protein